MNYHFYSTLVPNTKHFPHLRQIYNPRFNKEFFKRLRKNSANLEHEIKKRGPSVAGLTRSDLDYVIENSSEYVKLKEQFESYPHTDQVEDVDSVKWKIKGQLEALEERLIPIVLKLPNRTSKLTPDCDKIVDEVKPDRSSLGKLTKVLSHTKLSYINNCYSKSVVGPNSYYYYGIGAKLQLALEDYFSSRLEDGKNFVPVSGMCLVKSPVVESTNCRVKKDFATDSCRIISEGAKGNSQHLVEASRESLMSLITTLEPRVSNEPLRLVTSGAAYRAGSDWFDSDTKCTTQYQTTHALTLTSSIENYSMKEYSETKDLLWESYRELQLPLRLVHLSATSMYSNEYNSYSIDAWLPSKQIWIPVSRISHYLDYITLRAGMKRGHIIDSKVFDGQVLAAAIIENRQTPLGKFVIPSALESCCINFTNEEKRNYFDIREESELETLKHQVPYSVSFTTTKDPLLNYEQRRFLVKKNYEFGHSKKAEKSHSGKRTISRLFLFSIFLLLYSSFDWKEVWYRIIPTRMQGFLYDQLYRRMRRIWWKIVYTDSNRPKDLPFDEIDKALYHLSPSERKRLEFYRDFPERQKAPTTVKVD